MGTTDEALVLIAEDDIELRTALERILEFEGFAYRSVRDGAAALSAVAEHRPAVIVLDVMMPFVDGLTVCRRLRNKGDRTPILMLTGRCDITDRIAGLDAGADDYMTKPFSMDELLARIRALLRRRTPDEGPRGAFGLVLDTARRTVTRDGRHVKLTRTEFELLNVLLTNPGIVLHRSRMYEEVWGYDFDGDSKALDVHISSLRRKLETAGEDRIVQTVRGIGYVLRTRNAH